MDLTTPLDTFPRRHLGPGDRDRQVMLREVGVGTLDELVAQAIPKTIRSARPLEIGAGRGEAELAAQLHELAGLNQVCKSFIGLGYHDTVTPPVIQRNILENPGWYTQYTPYQAEIAQGRLEALLNFQTMVSELTGLPVANASLLDEGTAAAEAMGMAYAAAKHKRGVFVVARECHPQTKAVVRTRADALGVTIVESSQAEINVDDTVCGVLLQVPASDGSLVDPRETIARAKTAGALVAVATDLLALTLLTPPGELGADVAVGSAQRFGVPLGYGGPHAAFLATTAEHQRQIPGRVIGVSKDAQGRPAFRLALQTREQHIRRERATSNICTAQVLLAVMAGMYAVYHGPEGLKAIAERVHGLTGVLAAALRALGYRATSAFFDTLSVPCDKAAVLHDAARARRINLRAVDEHTVGVALDETTTLADVSTLVEIFAAHAPTRVKVPLTDLAAKVDSAIPAALRRRTPFLTHEIFQRYHSETEMLRYMRRLELKDLALNEAMIPLGSCTMKLNATTEMLGLSMSGFSRLHPFAPIEQAKGYAKLIADLEGMLREITGFSGVSLQPNAGSQGELAGLLVIRAYHASRGEHARKVCLIPESAHGTNPASAVMAGMQVVVVKCDAQGNIDVGDLRARASEHGARLAALMVTYPSTHGVFETAIGEICQAVHDHGGQVYLDGANLNALVGLCRPAEIGADVCHLNLHKTFAIPHGGGGPGMGPIACAAHLAPFLPGHPVLSVGGAQATGPVSAAPWGSASVLTISWAYMRLMGGAGLTEATAVAILNANYMAARLGAHFPIVYRGPNGRVAHEFILDMRPFKASAGVSVDDVAKRLMDYGFHSPTMSFPVPGTLMIEPTESESKAELDRFCDAMIAIRKEIEMVERGAWPKDDNPLVHAPHTLEAVTATEWAHAYRREQAAFPMEALRRHKFWPAVARIDNVFGDRNIVCTCPPLSEYA